MNNLLLYVKNRKWFIAAYMLSIIIFLLVFFLYGTNMEPLIYSYEIITLLLVIVYIKDYFDFYRKHKQLQKEISLENIYDHEIQQSLNIIEMDYENLVNRLIADIKCEKEKNSKKISELRDYYAVWAHQIKTPIAAMNLLLQVMENDESDELKADEMKHELFKIDMYVDSVMNYLRLEDMSNDFVFENVKLKEIVKSVVKKFAHSFIYKHIRVEMGEMERIIITDKKWFEFVIEQILSNALKYTADGGIIKIYQMGDSLVIEDNGIGISDEDIPRIMERGYTGLNGRMNKKSSGIGLYLCKKAGEKLGLEYRFESELDVGTKVFIDITQEHMVHE